MPSRAGWAALLLGVAAGCSGGGQRTAAPAAPPGARAAGEEGGKSGAAQKAAPAAKPAPTIDPSLIPEPGAPLVRETYSYVGGSRDPFASVLEGPNVGPELTDLDLVGVIYVERDPHASTAVLRDRVSTKQYMAHEGERIGQARVKSIGLRDVTFTIDDFGMQREVTLSLRKREVVP